MTQSAIPKFRRQIVVLSISRIAMMPQVARANPPNHETRYVNAFTRLERVLALRRRSGGPERLVFASHAVDQPHHLDRRTKLQLSHHPGAMDLGRHFAHAESRGDLLGDETFRHNSMISRSLAVSVSTRWRASRTLSSRSSRLRSRS